MVEEVVDVEDRNVMIVMLIVMLNVIEMHESKEGRKWKLLQEEE